MANISRRSFVAAGLGGAALTGLSGPSALVEATFAGRPFTRFSATSANGQANLEKLAKAVGIMRGYPPSYTDTFPFFPDAAFPVSDVRSWVFQWFTHWIDAFQAFQFSQSQDYKASRIADFPAGQDKAPALAMWNTCQAHTFDPQNPNLYESWFFLPWHRMFLLFFEQVVRDVLSDSSFSLPYWDTTSGDPSDTAYPVEFRDDSSPLFDDTRFANDGSPVGLLFNRSSWVSVNALKELFYIDKANGAFGFCPQVDLNPHFIIHQMTGGNMRNGFNTAAKDPLFWVHHCNIDRLWESWNRIGGENPTDPRWLNRRFTFANPDGSLVKVRVGAVGRVSQLGYKYDSYVPPPPAPSASHAELERARAMPQVVAALGPRSVALGVDATRVPLVPVSAARGQAAMPLARRIDELPPGRQIYLQVEGMRARARPDTAYGLYLDLARGATPRGTSDPHFVAVMAFPPDALAGVSGFCGSLHRPAYNITEVLRRLNADKMLGATAASVTIAPFGTLAGDPEPTIGPIAVIEA